MRRAESRRVARAATGDATDTPSPDAEGSGVLTQLRALLAQPDCVEGDRLPPERQLAELLGATRNGLRKALATLEQEGRIWRHVGRGTFVGPRVASLTEDARSLAGRTSPADVMAARLAFEPSLARLAALHATANDIGRLERCAAECRGAEEWRVYETWDNRLHETVAELSGNTLLIALFETLNTVRRAVVWRRLRPPRTTPGPGADHHSHAEHEALVEAIAHHDPEAAERAMRRHLESVRAKLLGEDAHPIEKG